MIFLFKQAKREKPLSYTKEEAQAEVWDEYTADIDKDGHVVAQKARVGESRISVEKGRYQEIEKDIEKVCEREEQNKFLTQKICFISAFSLIFTEVVKNVLIT